MDTGSPNDSDAEARDRQLVQYQVPKEDFSPQFLELLDAERELSPTGDATSSQARTCKSDCFLKYVETRADSAASARSPAASFSG